MSIAELLQPYQRFGVNLGLTRMTSLLEELGNPQRHVPFIHVGGTNGKGSVCAYLSSVLATAGYRVSRYTSPHLVRWEERVTINEHPIETPILLEALQRVIAIAPPNQENSPTLFEVFTAAIWAYFAEIAVDIAVMEVGLGGRLDATNVPEAGLASVIASLSREHWQVLGPTVVDIAREKAGIFKADTPAFVGQVPPETRSVFTEKAEAVRCPLTWIPPAKCVQPATADHPAVANAQGLTYELPLLGEYQLSNSALAVAVLQTLFQQGWTKLTESVIQQGMAKAHWPGRLQWAQYQGQTFLLDGAHNPAAAKELATFVHAYQTPVNWVMGMLITKEHDQIFQHLLRSGDRLWLVPVPGHKTADPAELATLAQTICPQLAQVTPCDHWQTALEMATTLSAESDSMTVFCGSLYLVGDFLATVGIASVPGKGNKP